MESPKGRTEGTQRKVFEEIMGKIFLKLTETTNPQVEEAHEISSTRDYMMVHHDQISENQLKKE